MTLRVTSTYLNSRVTYFSQVRTRNLAQLQYQASTGLRIARPSDDPSASQKLFSLKRDSAKLDAEYNNVVNAQASLNQAVSSLVDAQQLIREAERLASSALSLEAEERSLLARQVDQLATRLAGLANSQSRDQFLFGGQATSAPYEKNDNRSYPPYFYRGGNQTLDLSISTNVSVELVRPGDQIFGTAVRSETLYLGRTGAVSGTGTDSGISRADLLVTHSTTSYLGASGVSAGLSSPGGDSVIGQAGTHQIEIVDQSGTGANGLIRLNGGEFVEWTSADTDLQVKDDNGDFVYVDTQNMTAGFNGTVDLVANGTLSVDDNQSTIAIDFSNNQQVLDSSTGTVVNVNSTSISRTGTEPLEFTGTSDVFAVLQELKEDLLNDRELNRQQLNESLARRQGELAQHADHVLQSVGGISAQLETLAAVESRNRDFKLQLASLTSEIESADITNVVVRLQEEQNLLQYNFATSSTILNLNVLDFIR